MQRRTPIQKAALYTSSAFFAVGAVAHAVRLIAGFEIIVAGVMVPVWMSLPGALIAGMLATWMAIAARRS